MAIRKADTLKPGGSSFPIVEASDIKGGLHSVRTRDDRDAIKSALLEEGTLCYVQENNKYYKYKKDDDGSFRWVNFSVDSTGGGGGGIGIPILSKTQLEDIDVDDLDTYISIQDSDQEVEDKSQLAVVMEALQVLQTEVTRLNNTFKYGITSYQDTYVANDYGDIEQIHPYPDDPALEEEEDDEPTETVPDEDPGIRPDWNDAYSEIAHIAIRTVATYEILKSILNYLSAGELIYVRKSQNLYIVDPDNGLTRIGSKGLNDEDDNPGQNPEENPGGDNDNGMNTTQLINILKSNGIIIEENGGDLKINKIASINSINFVNEDTKKEFDFKVDAYGNLKGTEHKTANTLKAMGADKLTGTSVRGVLGRLGYDKAHKADSSISESSDLKLNSDRLKIGAIYAPYPDQQVYGCSHAFIELENTSNLDIDLEGVSLLYFSGPIDDATTIYELPLDGIIKAGSTYLIRGKEYSKDSVNTFINVNTFDKEWYLNGNLMDLTIKPSSSDFQGMMLVYKDNLPQANITAKTNDNFQIYASNNAATTGISTSKATYVYNNFVIDALVYSSSADNTIQNTWSCVNRKLVKNSIIKNTFELDPAKQAFQSMNTIDSSRSRFGTKGNATNDTQNVCLDSEFITFPKSDEKYPVSRFAPKASFEHKNVATDKSKLDLNKPNMVTCSFGIDIYRTRCFNWISAGLFDEYVWIKNDGGTWTKFESYKKDENDFTVYAKVQELIKQGASTNAIMQAIIGTPDSKYDVNGDGSVNAADSALFQQYADFTHRVEFDPDMQGVVYNRMTGRFPGDNTQFTAHKCILTFEKQTSPKTITYVVGRALTNNTPDPEHCSDEMTFTLYPDTYVPRVYQITDQQGFHWIEYQVWAGAAKELNKKINADAAAEHIIPILINTGDMTQNGTRINEWLDYYNAGKCLFNHLEQMNVVGNNDLCGTDFTILGTGDDEGKSNSYYFHLFYCYEIDSENAPVLKGLDNITRYVPSLYYFDSKDQRFLMVNSELTQVNCRDWYKLYVERTVAVGTQKNAVNAYTGWEVNSDASEYMADTIGFTPLYKVIYNIINSTDKKVLTACHEMPFTVITCENLDNTSAIIKGEDRSINAANSSLVGSHLNTLGSKDVKSRNWFSRMLEYFQKTKKNIIGVIGGHKHTYACTYPVRENYQFKVGDVMKSSITDFNDLVMTDSLKDEVIVWADASHEGYNSSKLPLVKVEEGNAEFNNVVAGRFGCGVAQPNLQYGITYFMCQATGYKLSSNKELPSSDQKFSYLVPGISSGSSPMDKQLKPMFAIVNFDSSKATISLYKFDNIKKGKNFTQFEYGTSATKISLCSKGSQAGTGEEDWKEYQSTYEANTTITINYEA